MAQLRGREGKGGEGGYSGDSGEERLVTVRSLVDREIDRLIDRWKER